MTILLYNRLHLQDRTHKNLRVWKGCHITVFILAAIFGILNSYFLFLTLRTFDSRCVLDPHELVFQELVPDTPDVPSTTTPKPVEEDSVTSSPPSREPAPLMLSIPQSQFRQWGYCDLPLSAPLVSAVVAIVWAAMFIVCPSGGRSKRGSTEPWTILMPALVFSLVFLFFTGHNFFGTNGGLQELCLQFHNVTNTESCTRAMDAHVPPPTPPLPRTSLSPSAGIAVTRALCAGAFACWAVASALLLARCLSGPDFALHSTRVHLRPPKLQKTPLQRRSRNPKRVHIAEPDIHVDAFTQEGTNGTTLEEGNGTTIKNGTSTWRPQDVSVDPSLHIQATALNST